MLPQQSKLNQGDLPSPCTTENQTRIRDCSLGMSGGAGGSHIPTLLAWCPRCRNIVIGGENHPLTQFSAHWNLEVKWAAEVFTVSHQAQVPVPGSGGRGALAGWIRAGQLLTLLLAFHESDTLVHILEGVTGNVWELWLSNRLS